MAGYHITTFENIQETFIRFWKIGLFIYSKNLYLTNNLLMYMYFIPSTKSLSAFM